MIRIILTLILFCAGFVYLYFEKKVTKIELPEGELKWSYVKPKNAKMCIPAAFTEKYRKIYGSYRYHGKTYYNGKALNMRVSLKGDSFYISKKWMSDNGFQQLTLVYNSKPMMFRDSRKAIRRALCKDENATYLDMGEYGYGYIRKNNLIRPLHIWGFLTRNKQTNWIYIE